MMIPQFGRKEKGGAIPFYAERLRAEVKEAFQGRDVMPAPAKAQPRANLPAKCPSCGAPLRPDEVAWTAPASAECPYCGSVVKAE